MLSGEWLEATIFVALVWLGVKYFGAVGAGMAFAVGNIWYLVWIIVIARLRHEFVMDKGTRDVVLTGLFIVVFEFWISFISSPIWRHIIGLLILSIAVWWSLKGLVERLGYEHFMNGLQKVIGRRARLKLDSTLLRFYR